MTARAQHIFGNCLRAEHFIWCFSQSFLQCFVIGSEVVSWWTSGPTYIRARSVWVICIQSYECVRIHMHTHVYKMESSEILVLMKGCSQILMTCIRTLFNRVDSLFRCSYMSLWNLQCFCLYYYLDPMLMTVEVHVCRNISGDDLR